MNDADQNETLRELLRDALEICSSSAAGTRDAAARSLFERTRERLSEALREHDEFGTKAG